MYYLVSLLNHLKHIKACMTKMKGEAFVNAHDMSLEVRVGDQTRQLLPQFSLIRDGRRIYTPNFIPEAAGFVGWRPYLVRNWPLASDKLAFKAHVEASGLKTPPYWREPGEEVRRFLVKGSKSSFGQGVHGPFERVDPANKAHELKDGDFYESFIPGRIVKAWYWNGELVCLEVRPPPFVVGDGRATVLELATRRNFRQVDQTALRRIVASQGLRLEDVPAEGKRVVVDFKYGSSYEVPFFENENVLAKMRNTAIVTQLRKAGEILDQAIPEDVRRDTVFTLDAVADMQDVVWLLEMNSNPMVHPDVYPAMLKSIFENPQADNLRQQLEPPPAARRYH